MYIILIIALVVAIAAYIAVKLTQLNIQKLILVVVGLIVGSLIGALLSVPLNKLPGVYGDVLPIVVTIISVIAFVAVFYLQHKAIVQLFPKLLGRTSKKPVEADAPVTVDNKILVDTSAIIDGRIADIIKTGFVPGKLLVPRFVLAELQNIADSEDSMRRGRGRRGLEVLNMMRQNELVEIDIVEEDPANIKEVDHKLVFLAKKYRTNILTTDYNLNRVATIEDVHVLNINELANAIRAVVLPGEELVVKVVQPGKEKNQGVGYLPDGTMIVVENGDKLIGKEVSTEVTRIFQTVAGKMIFAAEKGRAKSSKNGSPSSTNGLAKATRNDRKAKLSHSNSSKK